MHAFAQAPPPRVPTLTLMVSASPQMMATDSTGRPGAQAAGPLRTSAPLPPAAPAAPVPASVPRAAAPAPAPVPAGCPAAAAGAAWSCCTMSASHVSYLTSSCIMSRRKRSPSCTRNTPGDSVRCRQPHRQAATARRSSGGCSCSCCSCSWVLLGSGGRGAVSFASGAGCSWLAVVAASKVPVTVQGQVCHIQQQTWPWCQSLATLQHLGSCCCLGGTSVE